MSSNAVHQPTTEWLGSGDTFPDLLETEIPSNEVTRQVLLAELPRKVAGSDPLLLNLQPVIPALENLVKTVVPRDPKYCPLRWIHIPPPFYPALVASSPITLFKQIDANLSANRETYLVRVDWEPIFTQTNDQDFDVSISSEVRIGLTLGNGAEASKTVKQRESFVGLTVKYGHTSHTFSQQETENLSIVPIHYKVPAKSKVFGYQKKYTFVYRVWFAVNTDNTAHNVGPDGNPEQGFILTTVKNEEILVSERELFDKVAGIRVKETDQAPGLREKMIDIGTMSKTVDSIISSTKSWA